jgi:vacuolar-type H+-ATPase subunit I/STV1
MGYTADITGFPYWKNTVVKSLKNENKFYLRKMEKMRKKINKLEEESKVDKEFQEEVVQEKKELQCKYDAERLARAPRLWNELKEENKKLKEESKENKEFQEVVSGGMKLKECQREELLYSRFYAYTLDRGGDYDLTKEDVDKFTDDEALRKTLYVRIGYEQEREDYKSFGVMFVDAEDEDEDDIDFFDTEFEAQKLMNDLISSNSTSSHPYPEGKLILFRSHKYNPHFDNENNIPIVREMKIGTDVITNLDSLLGQLKKRINEKTRK